MWNHSTKQSATAPAPGPAVQAGLWSLLPGQEGHANRVMPWDMGTVALGTGKAAQPLPQVVKQISVPEPVLLPHSKTHIIQSIAPHCNYPLLTLILQRSHQEHLSPREGKGSLVSVPTLISPAWDVAASTISLQQSLHGAAAGAVQGGAEHCPGDCTEFSGKTQHAAGRQLLEPCS